MLNNKKYYVWETIKYTYSSNVRFCGINKNKRCNRKNSKEKGYITRGEVSSVYVSEQ